MNKGKLEFKSKYADDSDSASEEWIAKKKTATKVNNVSYMLLCMELFALALTNGFVSYFRRCLW